MEHVIAAEGKSHVGAAECGRPFEGSIALRDRTDALKVVAVTGAGEIDHSVTDGGCGVAQRIRGASRVSPQDIDCGCRSGDAVCGCLVTAVSIPEIDHAAGKYRRCHECSFGGAIARIGKVP